MSLSNAMSTFNKERFKKVIPKPKKPKPYSEKNLDNVLSSGGECSYEFVKDGKKVKTSISVDSGQRVNNNVKKYKFHVRNSLGYRVYVKATSRKSAQDIINSIYGKGYYTVSGSDV